MLPIVENKTMLMVLAKMEVLMLTQTLIVVSEPRSFPSQVST